MAVKLLFEDNRCDCIRQAIQKQNLKKYNFYKYIQNYYDRTRGVIEDALA